MQRNRYWGTPLPLWVSDDGEEVVCIGSIEELQKLSGRTDITDLHREFVDDITIPSRQGKGVLRRVPEVFDCWFESGSMPYAQQHYPFEHKVVCFVFISSHILSRQAFMFTIHVIIKHTEQIFDLFSFLWTHWPLT